MYGVRDLYEGHNMYPSYSHAQIGLSKVRDGLLSAGESMEGVYFAISTGSLYPYGIAHVLVRACELQLKQHGACERGQLRHCSSECGCAPDGDGQRGRRI